MSVFFVASGFWDEMSSQKSTQNKPSTISKSVSSNVVNTTAQTRQQPQKQTKSKAKKEEQQVMKVFSNGPSHDEFTEWCIRALTDITSTIDGKLVYTIKL